uniref:MCAfunc domain-containing protein n=1 Tax=Oryza sativa subsp. japonica TaxID=39947 RepID=Q10L12_ORYSJ|nr:hypothetical protein LOC_Os03g24810 [Oryza sativa Japonica Group]
MAVLFLLPPPSLPSLSFSPPSSPSAGGGRIKKICQLHLRYECRRLGQHVKLVGGLLRELELAELMRREATRRPLERLQGALRRCYALIRACQDCGTSNGPTLTPLPAVAAPIHRRHVLILAARRRLKGKKGREREKGEREEENGRGSTCQWPTFLFFND